MELKKSPKADLQSKRSLFAGIGLVLALALMLTAFEWGTKEVSYKIINQGVNIVEEDFLANTRQDDPPPPENLPKAIVVDHIVVVENHIKVPSGAENLFDETGYDYPIIISPITDEEPVPDDIPEGVADQKAKFGKGGVDEFRKWVGRNIQFPEGISIQGRVVVRFTVDAQGKVVNVRVVKGVDPLLDDEVVRTIESSPRWTPGIYRNKQVGLVYTLPVVFELR